jgi:hypothetical protein
MIDNGSAVVLALLLLIKIAQFVPNYEVQLYLKSFQVTINHPPEFYTFQLKAVAFADLLARLKADKIKVKVQE